MKIHEVSIISEVAKKAVEYDQQLTIEGVSGLEVVFLKGCGYHLKPDGEIIPFDRQALIEEIRTTIENLNNKPTPDATSNKFKLGALSAYYHLLRYLGEEVSG
ncbi:MAG: hypothetical protein AAF702_42830 [Chloroflexota bacterium]